ncbi:MAG: type II toxin-antitoxin system RelB/DinJ family antitoxin [Oscillospiraceae bacterium]|nr:type II toxin-antitoxin system RelB/DinJ family antitoxin [Oscillospiraceae bacterium]
MEYTTFSIRMESDIKKQFDAFCTAVGMNTTTAFNMFARATLRERRLPFDVALDIDPFYSKSNMDYLRRVRADVESGRNMFVHELIEVDEDD